MIEGDLSKCFDTIDHPKLMALIENKILDQQFTRLIRQSLKAGYLEFRVIQPNIAGTPQGSIISPILANIFLHELDLFVNNLKTNFDIGTRAKNTNEYNRIRLSIRNAKKRRDMRELKKLYKISQTKPVMDFYDPNYKRLYYVRYADDWIVGIRGSLSDTKNILEKITLFCENMNLKVNETKTKITNLNNDKALFLGVNIFRSKHKKFENNQRLLRQIRMTAPIDNIRKKLEQTGYMKNGKAYPKFILMSNSHDQIIHMYNAVYRGYINYYSFVHNHSQLVSTLHFTLITSCAKLLATKFKLGTTAKVFKKFGNLLKGTKFSFIKPIYTTNYLDFKINASPIINSLFSSHKSIASLENLSCSICGSNYRVEMHHIINMKYLKPKTSKVDRIMIRAQRKQIPLCRECHMKKHRNLDN